MSDLRSPFLPAEVPAMPRPKWKCGHCGKQFPPRDDGGLFEHMDSHLAEPEPTPHANSPTGEAVVSEHCTRCEGGQIRVRLDSTGGMGWRPCLNCRNGRRTRPASSPESGIGIGPEYLGMVEDSERRLADEVLALRAALESEKAAHLATKEELARVQAKFETADHILRNLRERLATTERERDLLKLKADNLREAIEGWRAQVETLTKERQFWQAQFESVNLHLAERVRDATAELTTRLEEAEGLLALVPPKKTTLEDLDALEDDARSGNRPMPVTLTIGIVRRITALLAKTRGAK